MCGLFNTVADATKSLSGNSIGAIIGVGTTPMTESGAIKPSEGFYKNPDAPKDTSAVSKTKNTAAGNTAK